MKKFAKVMMAVAVVFLLGGIMLFVLGCVGGGGQDGLNESVVLDEDFTYTERTADGIIASLSVTTDINSIEFVQGDGEVFKFSYWLYKDDLDAFENVDGKVSLTVEHAKQWDAQIFPILIYPAEKSKVTVTVPSSFTGAIQCVTDVGAICISDFSDLESVTFHTDTGALSAEGLAVRGDVKMKGSTGSLGCKGIRAKGFEIRTAVGEIELSDLEAEEQLVVTSDTGSICADRLTAAEIVAESEVGSIEIESVSADSFRCKTGTGSVKLEVFGVASEYRIETKVSVGKSSVDGVTAGSGVLNPSASKSLYAESSVGSVHIRFAA